MTPLIYDGCSRYGVSGAPRDPAAERLRNDEYYMGMAVTLARLAIEDGDSGYGCVVVLPNEGHIIGMGRGSEKARDCTCHSEVIAIQAAQHWPTLNGALRGATLYSTFEPCMYCCGAICHSKVSRVAWGASRSDLPHLYRRRKYTAEMLLADTSSPPELASGILREDCMAVTAAAPWLPTGDRGTDRR